MRKIPTAIKVIIGVIVAAKVAWSTVYPSGTWRYKTTVVVDTPEGEKSGSAVREVRGYCKSGISHPVVCRARINKGEAVVVDLGQRGVLFALMSKSEDVDYGKNIAFKAFPHPDPHVGPLTPEGIRYYSSLKAGPVVLTPENYPMFVRFRDLKDPKTVENVYETEYVDEKYPHGGHWQRFQVKADHFEEMFGSGVKLKEVRIEMTEESVSEKIEKYFSKFDWTSPYVSRDAFQLGEK